MIPNPKAANASPNTMKPGEAIVSKTPATASSGATLANMAATRYNLKSEANGKEATCINESVNILKAVAINTIATPNRTRGTIRAVNALATISNIGAIPAKSGAAYANTATKAENTRSPIIAPGQLTIPNTNIAPAKASNATLISATEATPRNTSGSPSFLNPSATALNIPLSASATPSPIPASPPLMDSRNLVRPEVVSGCGSATPSGSPAPTSAVGFPRKPWTAPATLPLKSSNLPLMLSLKETTCSLTPSLNVTTCS